MDRVEADLGVLMDLVEAAGVVLVGGSDLRVSLDTADARAAPLRYGIVRRTSFVQDNFYIDGLAGRFRDWP